MIPTSKWRPRTRKQRVVAAERMELHQVASNHHLSE